MGMIEFEPTNDYSANIKVIGIGGGGGNAVNAMVRSSIQGVEFVLCVPTFHAEVLRAVDGRTSNFRGRRKRSRRTPTGYFSGIPSARVCPNTRKS